MYDIVALGELLIDFAPAGDRTFQANAGGAPANVLAAAAKLGKRTAFIGMVGNDDFGDLLEKDLRAAGIDTTGLCRTDSACTTLAFVQLDARGDRSFTFVRRPGADMLLSPELVNESLINEAKIFHFGSVSMTDEPARSATLAAASCARERGVTVSYDPNLRPLLWRDLREAKEVISSGLQYADILKISEEELEFLTGQTNLEKGSAQLMEFGPKAVFVTLGPKGCFFRCAGGNGKLPTYDTKVIDTTGSGDAFLGGALVSLLEQGVCVDRITLAELEKAADFGNCAGALAATKKGAIPAMPDRQAMEDCQKTVKKFL